MSTDPHGCGTLRRVSGSPDPWPLLEAAAARAHEARARAEHPAGTLMARAGLAVARLALALAPRGRRVAVLCGPGDNGGDAAVAARHLHSTGWAVQLYRVEGRRVPSADTLEALAAAQACGLPATPCPSRLPPVDLVIDGLLGLGSQGAPESGIARAIAAVRANAAPVLAIDLPSGLHPDTGTVLGDEAIAATATLCALSLRPGCFTHQGRDHAGTVWLADLGHPADEGSAWLAGAPKPQKRAHASHKGRFGDVAVLGGAPGMTGAARLAAEAALAAGAGRVFATMLDEAAPPSLRPEVMRRELSAATRPQALLAATVVAGCGGGTPIVALLPALLAHSARLVLDADALNAIAADPALRTALRARSARGRPTLLTPHPLEAARLLATDVSAVQRDRFAAVRALATETGAAVLLKGSGSIIAAPGTAPQVNPNGNAALATAGTGDVLAGWAAGRWSGTPDAPAAQVGAEAAWCHGATADHYAAALPGRPLRAADLIEHLLGLR